MSLALYIMSGNCLRIEIACFDLLSLEFVPTAGAPAGHELNSQPEEPTTVGVASEDPVPDLFSAGADMTICEVSC